MKTLVFQYKQVLTHSSCSITYFFAYIYLVEECENIDDYIGK
jgi:hypothetical protein